jgi:hypothetical protein
LNESLIQFTQDGEYYYPTTSRGQSFPKQASELVLSPMKLGELLANRFAVGLGCNRNHLAIAVRNGNGE